MHRNRIKNLNLTAAKLSAEKRKKMNFETWLLLLATCGGISLIPGQNSLMVFNHVTLHGVRKTLWTIFGGWVGFFFLTAVSVFGVGEIIQKAPSLLISVKAAGGFYLLMIAIKLWRAPPIEFKVDALPVGVKNTELFIQGFISATTNISALMFFTAIFPNFICSEKSLFVQFLVIGFTMSFMEAFSEFLFLLAGDQIREIVVKWGRGFNRVCAVIFVVLAIVIQCRN